MLEIGVELALQMLIVLQEQMLRIVSCWDCGNCSSLILYLDSLTNFDNRLRARPFAIEDQKTSANCNWSLVYFARETT